MKAIILAAGMGKRIQQYSHGAPKCLLPFHNETLLTREIRMLKEIGFASEDILVVGGYRHEMLKNCGATLIVNELYDKKDNAYSLGLALRQIENESAVVMDADMVFDKAILEEAVNNPFANVVLTKRMEDLSESTGIVIGSSGTIDAIGKQYKGSGYVYISIFKIGKEAIKEFITLLFSEKFGNTWYTAAMTELMKTHPFYNVVVQKRWHEIDFPEDYIETKRMFGEEGEKK